MSRLLLSLGLALACTCTSWGQSGFFPWMNGRQPVRNSVRRVMPNNFRSYNNNFNYGYATQSQPAVQNEWTEASQPNDQAAVQGQQVQEGQNWQGQAQPNQNWQGKQSVESQPATPATEPTSSYTPSPEQQQQQQQYAAQQQQQQQPAVEGQQPMMEGQQYEQSGFTGQQTFSSPSYYNNSNSRYFNGRNFNRARSYRPVRSFFGR